MVLRLFSVANAGKNLDDLTREDIEGTARLDQYIHDKIIFDTDDDGFTQIITGLDMAGNDIAVVNDHDDADENTENQNDDKIT